MILLSITALLAASGQGSPDTDMRLLRYPTVRGDTVIFSYASDLWVTKLGGGEARRLTSHPGNELLARISPDGKWVAFTGQYEGNSNVYVMPIEGGEPKRLTFDIEQDQVWDWTPDGKIAYTSTAGNRIGVQRLWTVDPRGGLPQKTPIMEIANGTFFADGKRVAYNRKNNYTRNWRRYRGGNQGRVSIYDLASNSYTELPVKDENQWFPMAAGNAVYYISDRNAGTLNLYKYDLGAKRESQVTNYNNFDIKWPSTDGKTIVFERDGYLYAYDIASDKTDKIAVTLRSDNTAARATVKRLDREIAGLSVSPTGARIAAAAHGEVFSIPTRSGETYNLTRSPGTRDRNPVWTPDGQSVVYLSDADGEWQLYRVSQTGGTPERLSNHQGASISSFRLSPNGKFASCVTLANDLLVLDLASKTEKRVLHADYGSAGDYDWSPDSAWIAYSVGGKGGFSAVYLYELASDKATRVSEGRYDDNNPAFDLNGKYLYFSSARTFRPGSGRYELSLKVEFADRIYMVPLAKDTPNPLLPGNELEPAPGQPGEGAAPQPGGPKTRIDLEGIENRLIVLPVAAGNIRYLSGATDGVNYWMGTQGKQEDQISRFDLRSKRSIPILASAPDQFGLNANRTKIATYSGGREPVMTLVEGPAGQPGAERRVSLSGVQALVDPRAEWRQIYWDAWRFERDRFYDPQMLGMDWKAIGDHYAQMLPYVSHRSDLSYVLGLMIGELGTSHAYVNAPPPDLDEAPRPQTSGLGAEYEVVGNNIRFAKVYEGRSYEESLRAPLAEPGVNVKSGEFLLAIDGIPVTATTHPNAFLVNKGGQMVTLTVNDRPTMDGARKVVVRPTESESSLRFLDWYEETRRKVDQMSGGRIGYIYLPNTGNPGQVEFIRGFYSQTDKDAVIVDERWNGGGNVQPFIVPTLQRVPFATIQTRASLDSPDMAAIPGPKVMLINAYAGSGGDYTPWMFRRAKLGPLIGERTWGGLVGIEGYYTLLDGGQVSAPSFGFHDPETGEWIAENKGVAPDIAVDDRPDLIAKGQDPTLEKAVDVLMDQLRKQKPSTVKKADFPKVKSGGGRR